MKAKTITALVLASGFLTTAAFADDPPATPALSPTPITALSLAPNQIVFTSPRLSIAKLVSVAPAPAFTINWIIPSAHDLSVPGQFANWRPKTVSDQLLSDADAGPSELAAALTVSARPPPTVNFYDPFATTYRDPPVFFRLTFNFGRSHRS
jgi:hypothetical protein